MTRRPHPLTVALASMLASSRGECVAPPPKRTHFQVYTNASGSLYHHNPAYMGDDREAADRIAAEVGGVVEICDGAP